MESRQTFSLNKNAFPYRLYQKSKQCGLWDPERIDFSQDRIDWNRMGPKDQQPLLELVSMFYSGEQSVAEELIPLIYAVEKDGRIEEVMFLTSFLFEEAKHVEFFSRFVEEVIQSDIHFPAYHSKGFQQIYYRYLPEAMQRLLTDQSPEALAIASTTYHMIAEDINAEIGCHHLIQIFGNYGIMPGLIKGFRYIMGDEGRHIAYGTYLLQRLIREHGDHIYELIRSRFKELYPYCTGTVGPLFSHLVKQRMNSRLRILGKACSKAMDDVIF